MLEHMQLARSDATINYLNELLGWEWASLKVYDQAIGELGPTVNSACMVNRNCHLCNMAQVRELISSRGGVPVGDNCRTATMCALLERGAAAIGPLEIVTSLTVHEKHVLVCYQKHRKLNDIDEQIHDVLESHIMPAQAACYKRMSTCHLPLT